MAKKGKGTGAARWRTNRSALTNFKVKHPAGFESWFYQGPSLDFGHPNDSKKAKR